MKMRFIVFMLLVCFVVLPACRRPTSDTTAVVEFSNDDQGEVTKNGKIYMKIFHYSDYPLDRESSMWTVIDERSWLAEQALQNFINSPDNKIIRIVSQRRSPTGKFIFAEVYFRPVLKKKKRHAPQEVIESEADRHRKDGGEGLLEDTR